MTNRRILRQKFPSIQSKYIQYLSAETDNKTHGPRHYLIYAVITIVYKGINQQYPRNMNIERITPSQLAMMIMVEFDAQQFEDFLRSLAEQCDISADNNMSPESREAMLETRNALFDAQACWAARPGN